MVMNIKCGSWKEFFIIVEAEAPEEMNTGTVLGLYNVLLFTEGFLLHRCTWLDPSPAPVWTGSIISSVQMRISRLLEADHPNNQCGHCPRGMGVASLTSHWHHSLVAGFRVWRGEGDVIPQTARLGSLADLHKVTAPAQVLCWLHFPGLIWLLAPGFPGSGMAPPRPGAEEWVELLALGQHCPPRPGELGSWADPSHCLCLTRWSQLLPLRAFLFFPLNSVPWEENVCS